MKKIEKSNEIYEINKKFKIKIKKNPLEDGGIEPPTSWTSVAETLRIRHSTTELIPHMLYAALNTMFSSSRNSTHSDIGTHTCNADIVCVLACICVDTVTLRASVVACDVLDLTYSLVLRIWNVHYGLVVVCRIILMFVIWNDVNE